MHFEMSESSSDTTLTNINSSLRGGQPSKFDCKLQLNYLIT